MTDTRNEVPSYIRARVRTDKVVEQTAKAVRRAIIGTSGIQLDQVPTLVWKAVTDVEEQAKHAAGRGRSAIPGASRKRVVLDAVGSALDAWKAPEVTESDADHIKQLLPGIIDLVVSVAQGRAPDLGAFVADNSGALTHLGKRVCGLIKCCRKKNSDPDSDYEDEDDGGDDRNACISVDTARVSAAPTPAPTATTTPTPKDTTPATTPAPAPKTQTHIPPTAATATETTPTTTPISEAADVTRDDARTHE
jgi:hypothetical protein